MPNRFLNIEKNSISKTHFSISTDFVYTPLKFVTVLYQIIQFCINTQFKCQKQFYFKQFSLG